MTDHPTPAKPMRRHQEMLAVATLVLVLALVLQVQAEDRVIVSGLPDWPLPPMCMSYAWFGLKCPGCGLTRSIVYLAHGDWDASWKMHRLGWVMAAALLLQFPYRILGLWRRERFPLGVVFARGSAYLLIALLLGNWLVEIIGQWGCSASS